VKIPPLGLDCLPEGWPQDHGIPTLGPDVLAWGETTLVQPDGDFTGDPWCWRESQARFVCWWYSLDEDGRWLWRRGQIVLPKGSGKSPIAAALSCGELAGPVHFDGFDGLGEPIGRAHPSPWVQLAAVSQDQADNTMSLVLAMLRDGPAARLVAGLDCGLTRVRTRNGILQPVTASASSREGQRSTAAILDEPHLWNRANGGHRLASTIRRNLAKMSGRSLETTNCWVPGEDSVAQQTAEYAAKVAEGATTGDLGVLRWHPTADVDDLSNTPAVREALTVLYRDAPWVDVERIVAEIQDLGTDPQDSRRFYLNQITHATDSWISSPEWMGALKAGFTVPDGDEITLGFDGSRARSYGITDATALMGCHVETGHLFVIDVWEQPEGPAGKDWHVPTAAVDLSIANVFDRWNVAGWYGDPALWESWFATWQARYGTRLRVKASRENPIEFWMGGTKATRTVQVLEQFRSAILDKELTHDGHPALTRHVLNARRRVSRSGVQIAKEHPDSVRKIDLAVAAVLAYAARLDAVASAPVQERTYAARRIKMR
jgi:hypothetical protein